MSQTTITNLNDAAATLDASVSALALAISGYHQAVAAAFGDLEARLQELEAGTAEPQPEPQPEPEPEPEPETPAEPLAVAAILNTTGGEWDRGVSTQSARFLVADTAENRAAFVEDNTVKFADGDVRKISAVTVNYGQVFVSVFGAVLNAATVGAPNSVEAHPAIAINPDPVEPPPSEGDLPLVGFNLAGLGNNPYVDPIATAVVGTHYRTPAPYHTNGNSNGQPDYVAAYLANLPAGKPFLVRLPFAGERIAILDGQGGFTLRANYVEEIRDALDYVHSHGGKVLLDMHNYCRWYKQVPADVPGRSVMAWGGGYSLWTAIGTSECPVTYPMLAQIWAAIAGQFKDHPALWGYGLMNEPHNNSERDMPGVNVEALWVANVQQIINAVRAVDAVGNITICGNGFATAKLWREKSDALKTIQDSAGKLFFEAHQYPDTRPDLASNVSAHGTGGGHWARPQPFNDSVDAEARVQDWADWVLWLKENGLKGFAGEFGGPADVGNMPAYLEQMHAFFDLHSIPRTQWLAGPGFGNGTYANGMNHESTGQLMPNAAALTSRIGRTATAYGPF